jgi:hypothetical protein
MSRLFAVLLFVAMIWAPSVSAGWFGPDNYEDCLLQKMKGQSRLMYPTVARLCKKRFHVEERIPVFGVEWELRTIDFSDVYGTDIFVKSYPGDGELDLTSGGVEWSEKSCAESRISDFHQEILPFHGEHALIKGNLRVSCVKLLWLRGAYY